MKNKPLQSYLIAGFSFANKNLDLYLISLSFSLLSIFIASQKSILVSLITIIITLIGTGYFFTLPLLLVYRKQKKKFAYDFFVFQTLSNTSKLILPFLLLLIGLIGLSIFTVLFFQLIQPIKISSDQIINILFEGKFFPVVFAFTMPIFIVTSFFFTLEKNSFYVAFLKAIRYNMDNPLLYGVFFVIGLIPYLLNDLNFNLNIYLLILIGQASNYYVLFILVSSGLLYFQDNPLKEK